MVPPAVPSEHLTAVDLKSSNARDLRQQYDESARHCHGLLDPTAISNAETPGQQASDDLEIFGAPIGIEPMTHSLRVKATPCIEVRESRGPASPWAKRCGVVRSDPGCG